MECIELEIKNACYNLYSTLYWMVPANVKNKHTNKNTRYELKREIYNYPHLHKI